MGEESDEAMAETEQAAAVRSPREGAVRPSRELVGGGGRWRATLPLCAYERTIRLAAQPRLSQCDSAHWPAPLSGGCR
jgi:hypothetical protein